MKKERGKLGHKCVPGVVFVVFVVSAFFFRAPILSAVGNFLVSEDTLRKADVIVVLMGSTPDRILHAVDLYGDGYGERILMARSHDFSNYEIIDSLKLNLMGDADVNKDVAAQLGVPETSIIILDGRADSTSDEAMAVKEYVEKQKLVSILLVTSKYHSARAKKTFSKVLGNDYRIISSPSPYDPFDPTDWWKDRRQARNVFFEYQKLLNFYLFRI